MASNFHIDASVTEPGRESSVCGDCGPQVLDDRRQLGGFARPVVEILGSVLAVFDGHDAPVLGRRGLELLGPRFVRWVHNEQRKRFNRGIAGWYPAFTACSNHAIRISEFPV